MLVIVNSVCFCLLCVFHNRLGSMRRIDAAKELFNAFVTRTQAYRLRHCFGLTLFSSTVTVKLPITKNTEEFEVSSKGLLYL